MHDRFGARLRQRREEQGIALVTIAEQTKISLPLLEALERDDVSHWPSGIFRRAFVRAYALAIGLDPDVAFREFVEAHPEPVDIAAAALAAAAAADAARTNGGPPTRLRQIVGSAFGSFSRRRRTIALGNRPTADIARVEPSPAFADPIPDSAADTPPETRPEPRFEPPAEPVRGETGNTPASSTSRPGADEVRNALPHPSPAADQIQSPMPAVIAIAPANPPGPAAPDLMAVAHLCTRFGRVENPDEIRPLLQEAAGILDAIGLIVWIWDPVSEVLRPALVHGYSDKLLAHIPPVTRDADNATAAAFRSAEERAIGGGDRTSGALVVPLLTPAGCAGVLAIELHRESDPSDQVRAIATIIAALLALLIGDRTAEALPQVEIDAVVDRQVEASWDERKTTPAAQ